MCAPYHQPFLGINIFFVFLIFNTRVEFEKINNVCITKAKTIKTLSIVINLESTFKIEICSWN